MKKTILIFFILLLGLMAIASAANTNTLTLDSLGILTNLSIVTNSTANHSFTISGNQTSYTCTLYTTENGSNAIGWHPAELIDANNMTNTTFAPRTGIREAVGHIYCWDIFCNGTTDPTGIWGGLSNISTCGGTHSNSSMNYSIDYTAPEILFVWPPNDHWFNTSNTVRFELNVSDTHPAFCKLRLNINVSIHGDNGTDVWMETAIEQPYTNASWFNFTNISSATPFPDNGTGYYQWSYECNDTAGLYTNLSTNRTFFMDTVAPSIFSFNESEWYTDGFARITNDTWCSDYTPQIGWNNTVDLNFSRYVITFFKNDYGTYNSSDDVRKTITAVNYTDTRGFITNITTLAADTNYEILITAIDLAGNERNISTKQYKYTTYSVGRDLLAGWNIIGITGNNFTLRDLRNWTQATTVSIYNSSDHEFVSHVLGGTGGQEMLDVGDVVLIYAATATSFSDLVFNQTRLQSNKGLLVNLTNQSTSDWNLVMARNFSANLTFAVIDSYLNCNGTAGSHVTHLCSPQNNNVSQVDFMSWYNNTASSNQYVSFVNNLSINNLSTVKYGEVLWMHLGGTDITGTDARTNLEIDWGAIK